jgi:exopolyphosphatase/guanosine-5'-triphosphate,3'-diphosphate pyrophosphatase
VRFACIDIGTNSVLLLVAEAVDGEIRALDERALITRLGEGVDATGALSTEGVRRTLAALEQYADAVRELHVDDVRIVGTSAMRDAQGSNEFRASIRALFGAEPEVLSGLDEAHATFAGALCGLSLAGEPHDASDAIPEAINVFDVGGGSTEVVHGVRTGRTWQVAAASSIDVGSVRMTERYVRHDPPLPSELEAVAEATREELGRLKREAADVAVGIAGTVTTLAAVHLGLSRYEAARIHGLRLSRADVDGIVERVAHASVAARRAMPGMEPKRADVIGAGAIVVGEVLRWLGARSMVVSDRGVRWGLAVQMAERARRDGQY